MPKPISREEVFEQARIIIERDPNLKEALEVLDVSLEAYGEALAAAHPEVLVTSAGASSIVTGRGHLE